MFDNITKNKVFCKTEYEYELANPFVKSNPMWKDYVYNNPNASEQLLQQLYGHYQGNLAAKEYALANSFNYTYKIRARPDTASINALPSYENMALRNSTPGAECPKSILFPNPILYGAGSWDSFNVGFAEDMDKLLDRYMELISTSFIPESIEKHIGQKWKTEVHLKHMLKLRYGICLNPDLDNWMWLTRTYNHKMYMAGFVPPSKVLNNWVDMRPERYALR